MKKAQKIKKGVIVVAGLGTRFLPVTKVIPKEMLPVLNKPVLQYIVEEMAFSGIKEIILVTNQGKRSVEDYFARDLDLEKRLQSMDKHHKLADLIKLIEKVKFSFAYQNEPLGNGHALLMAQELIGNEPFAFSDGDSIIDAKVPVIKQLITVFEKKKASVIGVLRLGDGHEMQKYGNVYGEQEKEPGVYKMTKLIEKPDLDNVSPHGLVVGGMRYIFTPDIWPVLESQVKGRENEIWLADAVHNLAQKKPFYAYQYQGKYLDTGNEELLLEANMYFFNKFNSKI